MTSTFPALVDSKRLKSKSKENGFDFERDFGITKYK